MKTIRITEELVQATDLAQLASRSGQRIKDLPFYSLADDDHNLIFHTLNGSTNVNWLKKKIAEGKIYLRNKTIRHE